MKYLVSISKFKDKPSLTLLEQDVKMVSCKSEDPHALVYHMLRYIADDSSNALKVDCKQTNAIKPGLEYDTANNNGSIGTIRADVYNSDEFYVIHYRRFRETDLIRFKEENDDE
jgi:hypothetical protein